MMEVISNIYESIQDVEVKIGDWRNLFCFSCNVTSVVLMHFVLEGGAGTKDTKKVTEYTFN